jgi:outer membrane protein TolC
LTLYRDGASSYLDVVTAQSAALDAERLEIAPGTRQNVAVIGLMLAFDGGGRRPPNRPPSPVSHHIWPNESANKGRRR